MFEGVAGDWNIPSEPKLKEYGGGKSNWCRDLSISGFCGDVVDSDEDEVDETLEARVPVMDRSLRRNFALRFWNLNWRSNY